MHQSDASCNVTYGISKALKRYYYRKRHEKETIITKGCKYLLAAFQFVGISSSN